MEKPFLEALREARALLSTAHLPRPSERAVARRLTRSLDEAIARSEGRAPGVDLVSVVCHDLKDPLASVVMGAGFLQKALVTEDEGVRRVVSAIARSAERLGQVISDFHDLSKLQIGTLPVDLRPCDVVAMLAGAVDGLDSRLDARLASSAREKGVKVVFDAPDGPRMAMCDRARFLQGISNLVANAIAFTDAGGQVSLSVPADQRWIRVVVSDTGRGIAAERLPFIFDHAANASRASRDGPGLGLAIAKGLVELQGGELSVTSCVAEGTSFEVRLPRAP